MDSGTIDIARTAPAMDDTGTTEAPSPERLPVVVLLHGRGSSEDDLISLHGHLGGALTVVTPRAPFPAAPWGYGPGWAWYRYIAEDRVDDETLDTSLAALDTFIETLPDRLGFTPSTLFIGGFSQGGTTALAWALTRPGRVAGVLNLSGFLVTAPKVRAALVNARGLRVFWGHGELDPAIPFALAARGRGLLAEAGAELDIFDHPGGHTITPGEVSAMRWFIGNDDATSDDTES